MTKPSKLKYPTKSHPGRAGRKPARFPSFLKKLRATEEERKEFERWLTGDARLDFILILAGLRFMKKSSLDKTLDYINDSKPLN